MDPYSSGEELIIKTRKPYTITKQRERWTEEEHNRFLEALKLYGRAWQRIEEYIGTKTAVQIRSHAQKFFTKLEKEALVKGVPTGQALDIEIPPPRPKRKPSNPYPRKTNVGVPSSHVEAKDGKLLTAVSCLHTDRQVLDLEKEPLLEKGIIDEKIGTSEEKQDKGNGSDVFTSVQRVPIASLSSARKNSVPSTAAPKNLTTLREFVPILKEDNVTRDTFEMVFSNPSRDKLVQVQNGYNLNQHEKYIGPSANDTEAAQNYPRHVPVHVLDGSPGLGAQNVSSNRPCQESFLHMGTQAESNLLINPAASATTEQHNESARSSVHQSFPTIHPFLTPTHSNQEDHRSFLHISSTLSSLIVSALLQNPAAHAAASFAATFWPCPNVEGPADSPTGITDAHSTRQMNSAPSMETIAAATVAAATAWWATHGLLPLCAPFHPSFNCTASTTPISLDNGQARAVSNQKLENGLAPDLQNQLLDEEYSEALQEQHSTSKSPSLSSSDYEESEGTKLDTGLTAADPKQTVANEVHDLNNMKDRKQVDRSSCGSNTPSSSEVETDVLGKHERGKDDMKEPDASHSAGDSSNRRGKSSNSAGDSWKEVSEEGRLAFQALFSREILPQSFFSPQGLKHEQQIKNRSEKIPQDTNEKIEEFLQLNLTSMTSGICAPQLALEHSKPWGSQKKAEEGLLVVGLAHGKLKACRTGFKPYKRCSVEAKECRITSTGNQDEEKGPKRIRLGGEPRPNC